MGWLVPLADLLERVTRRPRLAAHFDWDPARGEPDPPVLLQQQRPEARDDRRGRFGTDETPVGEGWLRQHAILERLPVTLEPHTASDHFLLTTEHPTEEFDRLLREGKIVKCIVETTAHRGHTRQFRVPPPVRDNLN